MATRQKSRLGSFLFLSMVFGLGCATWAYKVNIARYLDTKLSTSLTKYVK